MQVRPTGETVEVRATVPVNPLTGATVMVDVPVPPAKKVIMVGLADMVKSVTVKVTAAVWVMEPLVPVTVTVYVPAGPEQDSVEVCDAPSTMLVGLSEHVKPAGDTVEVRATVPVNPPIGATVIVEVAVAPASADTLVGLAVTLKSTWLTVNVTVAEWDSDPLVPVTVTVNGPNVAPLVQVRVEV